MVTGLNDVDPINRGFRSIPSGERELVAGVQARLHDIDVLRVAGMMDNAAEMSTSGDVSRRCSATS